MTTIKLAIDAGVATLTLARPDKRNALDMVMVREIAGAVRTADADEAVRVLLVTQEGPSFCAGIDTRFPFSSDLNELYRDGFTDREAMALARKPVIAAVSGAALGAGCELALMCDIVLADETAFFALPEITRATIPGFGGTQRLARLVGSKRAMEICLTARRVPAAEAAALGMITAVVPACELASRARAMADTIAAAAPMAAMMIKESIAAAHELPLSAGLKLERRLSQMSLGARGLRE